MPDALENQIMLQRLFAPTTEPLERLGQGQLALAQQNMLRQQALADQARAIIEAGKVRRETQVFQAKEADKYRTFQGGESAKARAHNEELAFGDQIFRFNQALANQDFLRDENKAARAAVKDAQVAAEKQAEKMEGIRAGHQKEYLAEHARLEKELKESIRKGELKSNTGAYAMLERLAQHEQRFIDNAGYVDPKEKNKIVRQVVESYKNYGKNTAKLDKWLDPNSQTDISLSLARVVDPKDLRTIQQDIATALTAYQEPQRLRAAFALQNIQALTPQKVALLRDGIDTEDLKRYYDSRGLAPNDDTDLPEELRAYPGGVGAPAGGGGAVGPATSRDMFNAAAGGAPVAAVPATATGGIPPELNWAGPPGMGSAIAAMGPPIVSGANAAYSALMNPTRAVGGVISNLNQSAYDMLQPQYNPVPVQFPGVGQMLNAATRPMSPMFNTRLPNVQNMADAIAPYAQPAKPLFGDPLQGFKDWQYQGIYNALAPSDTTPDQTIPPKLFIRMRQIAMRENPAITDAQITEGLNRARQGDPNATRILNHYKQLAIQSLAAESQFISTDSPPAPSF